MESNEIGLLAIKAESSYGLDPVPTKAANLIPIAKGSLQYRPLADPIDRMPLDGKILPLAGFNQLPSVEVQFDYELRGNRTNGIAADISSGSASNKVEIDPLLQAANLIPVYTAESGGGTRDGNVLYGPGLFTTVGPSVALYFWSALKLHKLLGGKVSFSMTWEAGKMAIAHFTIRGKYVAVSDVAFSTSGAVWVDTKPPVFEGGLCTFGAYAGVVTSKADFNLNNTIVRREAPVQTDAVEGFLITATKPTGSFDPESVAEATHPFWADWRAANVKALTLEMPSGSGASGNRLQLSVLAEPKDISYADRNGIRIHNAGFNIVRRTLSELDAVPFGLRFY